MPGHVEPSSNGSALDDDPARTRLRELLRASTSVVEPLELEEVLRRLVGAAMTIADARYGALGVLTPDGKSLERFIHVGMDAATSAKIGDLPHGRGLLGAVIADHVPIRLTHLHDDPRSIGFPSDHPPMDGFLGVPLRVGEKVYGNLYLTRDSGTPFSLDDETLIIALAATASCAIENARLYEKARSREAWSAATADVIGAMLEVGAEDVLSVIGENVGALLDVDLVAVAVPDGDGGLRVIAAQGATAQFWRGKSFPMGALSKRAAESRRALSMEVPTQRVSGSPEVGPTAVVPLFSADELLGIMTISRPAGSNPFSDSDLGLAAVFATQAGVAIELVRAREDRPRAEIARERAATARDLHDLVIQRLYGAGMSLQAVSATVDARASAAIDAQVDAFDAAIKDIRTVIYALSSSDRKPNRRTRDRMLGVVTESTPGLSATPRISFSGPLDSLVPDSVVDELAAVLRECLTNVAKHANADHVDVEVGILDGVVTLTVQDDGRGFGPAPRRSGVANISARAALLGGTCTIAARDGGGTRVDWSVPAIGGPEALPA